MLGSLLPLFSDVFALCFPFHLERRFTQTTGLPMGINFVQNPLYSNQIVAAALTNGAGLATNHAIYANLINNNQQQQAYVNLPGQFASACSVAASVSPLHGFPHLFIPSSVNQVTFNISISNDLRFTFSLISFRI